MPEDFAVTVPPEITSSHELTELIIEAGYTERNYWRDLFRYRELFYFLAWRDVLVRYEQTVIGVLWADLRPLLTMVVFTAVFTGSRKSLRV
ncbi:MAG TPA: hypothetical protein VK993_09770 [Chthoniobacterales bacterium]|nr:hypothetical protein [Chthoniobacterales bacterium]